VPAAIDTPGHIDDLGRAEVALSGVALAAGSSPTYDYGTLTCGGTYCHGPRSAEPSVSPPWTRTSGPLPCTSCHGLPPPLPHPQILQCNLCHQNVTEAFEMIDRSLHVNGRVDF
jgi:predicted CxxxxCH...CXXCH cytochrome family protein